jgi:hypothetical protein
MRKMWLSTQLISRHWPSMFNKEAVMRNLHITQSVAFILLSGVVICSAERSLTAPVSLAVLAEKQSLKSSPTPPQASKRQRRQPRKPDVIYYSTPPETVTEMLRLAGIKPGDVLYDLGSGDGRIPIAAAQQYRIRAVGIEIDPKLIIEADNNAQRASVSSLTSFRNEDMFRVNLSEATIVTLYLSEKLNMLLRPKLLRELRPGSRIISHDFRMGDWQPEQSVRVPWGKLYRTVYLWTVPAHTSLRKSR